MQVRKDLRSCLYDTEGAVELLHTQASSSCPACCFATGQPRDIFTYAITPCTWIQAAQVLGKDFKAEARRSADSMAPPPQSGTPQGTADDAFHSKKHVDEFLLPVDSPGQHRANVSDHLASGMPTDMAGHEQSISGIVAIATHMAGDVPMDLEGGKKAGSRAVLVPL